MSMRAEDRRRERWRRYDPYATNLTLVISEIGDEMDGMDARWDRFETAAKERWETYDRRINRLTGIATALLISTSTSVLMLAINLAVNGGGG